MTAPRWEDVPEADRERVARCIRRERDTIGGGWAHGMLTTAERDDEIARLTPAYNAALARLAEPSAGEPSEAVKAWREVPWEDRWRLGNTLAHLVSEARHWVDTAEQHEADPAAVHDRRAKLRAREALVALVNEAEGNDGLALAREAERGEP